MAMKVEPFTYIMTVVMVLLFELNCQPSLVYG
jgi:hypothetical protein